MIETWALLGKVDLFEQIHSRQGKYCSRAHLAEIIALLGPPPKCLVGREKEGFDGDSAPRLKIRRVRFAEVQMSSMGDPSSTPMVNIISIILRCGRKRQLISWPDEFLHKTPIPNAPNLADSVSFLAEGEKDRASGVCPEGASLATGGKDVGEATTRLSVAQMGARREMVIQ